MPTGYLYKGSVLILNIQS